MTSHGNDQKYARDECHPTKQGRLNVDEVGGSRNNLNPKVWWKRGNDLQRMSRLKKVMMLAPNNNILSIMSTLKEPSKCALLKQGIRATNDR